MTGAIAGTTALAIGIPVFLVVRDQNIKKVKLENERLYFEKLTPEMVKALEDEKLKIKAAEIELKNNEAKSKEQVITFKNDIHDDIFEEVMNTIHDEIRDTFDDWSSKYEDRLDKKVDRVVSRIDDLSDKYGGVKSTGAAPSISVVNAPNN